jgi:nucleoid-associated protein YgaU
MRKEVKLGMTLGGGVVAALVGYLLVAPPANKPGTTLAGAGDAAAGANGSIIEPQQPGELQAGNTDRVPANAAQPNAAGQDAAGQHEQQPKAPADAQPKGDEKPGAGLDQWNVLKNGKPVKPAGPSLAQGSGSAAATREQAVAAKPQQPKSSPSGDATVIANASPSRGRETTNLYYNPDEAYGGGVSNGPLFGGDAVPTGRTAKSATSDKPAPAAGPVAQPKAGSTHVVQSGETFSSIAQAAYGSASYFPHLIRANPAANPNNLKLGTTITIPPLDQVKATAGAAATATGNAAVTEEVKLDPTRQYRVASGDSLYKISLKVYGKSTYVEKLYDANKTAIGPNPTKLKLGMILDLPEKASAAPVDPTVAGGPVSDGENR